MRYRVEAMQDHVLASVQGPYDAADAEAVIREIGRACSEKQCSRVLIDARGLEGIVGTAERFGLARRLAEDSAGRIRFAILVDPAQLVSKTLEDTATNRGAQLRTTAVPGEAYAYLGVAPPS